VRNRWQCLRETKRGVFPSLLSCSSVRHQRIDANSWEPNACYCSVTCCACSTVGSVNCQWTAAVSLAANWFRPVWYWLYGSVGRSFDEEVGSLSCSKNDFSRVWKTGLVSLWHGLIMWLKTALSIPAVKESNRRCSKFFGTEEIVEKIRKRCETWKIRQKSCGNVLSSFL
jgi:hypothetical protein